jgi:hypothetical protein
MLAPRLPGVLSARNAFDKPREASTEGRGVPATSGQPPAGEGWSNISPWMRTNIAQPSIIGASGGWRLQNEHLGRCTEIPILRTLNHLCSATVLLFPIFWAVPGLNPVLRRQRHQS